MKVLKAIIWILVFLLFVAGFLYVFMYLAERDRFAKFEQEYTDYVEGNGSVGNVTWAGKVLDVDRKHRELLIQAYRFRKPVEGMNFIASNEGSDWTINVKEGDWVEIKGFLSGFVGDLPLVRTEFFGNWIYFYYDFGLKPD
ncbi:MAG: hypothetical protein U5N86_08175 [Planctomycetota bacterium]|nr:hypothetical protein [Planctomycetota bacterium]